MRSSSLNDQLFDVAMDWSIADASDDVLAHLDRLTILSNPQTSKFSDKTFTMGTLRLGLELPSAHDTYYDQNGDSFSDPIPGSVQFTAQTEAELHGLSDVQVSLVLVLSTSTQDEIQRKQQLSNRIYRFLSMNTPLTTVEATKSVSTLEQLTLCLPTVLADSRVGYSPEEGTAYKIPFFIPVPDNIPPTTVTELGSTTLFIVASAKRADGGVITTRQEIQVTRRILPGSDPIQHTRTYATSKVINEVTLTQSPETSTRSKLPLTAKISLRQPAAPTKRSTEFKCVGVRGIEWRVEEITKVFTKSKGFHISPGNDFPECEPIEEASFTRELFHGAEKGYWGTADNPMMKDQPIQREKDSTIEIPFEIIVPRTMALAAEVSLSCYELNSRPMNDPTAYSQSPDLSSTTGDRIMTVEHRLKLDVITSEDTFGAQDKNLVDRKPLGAARDASFPIFVVDKAPFDGGAVLLQATPPCYAALPASPPRYEPMA